MSQYSRDDLRQAARIVLADRQKGRDRWFRLVLEVAERARLNAQDVWTRILELAR